MLPSHPSPPLSSPTLPFLSGPSYPYPTILSLLLLFPRISSPTYLAPLSYPCIPYPPLPSPVPYHIPPDRSRGRDISFPTSLGYLNPSLLYPALLSPHPPTLRYPSTSYLSTLLPSHPIHSAHLVCPNNLSYCTLPSPLFSHLPLSPPLAYLTLPSPPVYPALLKDSEKVKGQDVLVPECIGAETVWCKMSFEGLKWLSAWKVQEMCRAETSWGQIVFGPTLTFV